MVCSWVAVDRSGNEYIYAEKPHRALRLDYWHTYFSYVKLPKGSIKKLIGKELTWNDEPVELTEKL